MALSPVQVSSLRALLGAEPADAELETLHDLHGSVDAVAYVVLSQRLTEMRENPTRFSVDGDATEDYTENLRALERQVARLRPLAGAGGTMTTGRLVRPSRRSRMIGGRYDPGSDEL